MKCAACGYDDVGYAIIECKNPFIEVFGLTGGEASYRTMNYGFETRAVAFRPDVKAYACPICGTVKMEV